MPRKRLLASWIGHNDMRACSMSLPAELRDEILAALPGPRPAENEAGPIKTLVEHEQFDEIRLLSNYPKDWEKRYATWLDGPVHVAHVALDNPADYADIFQIVNRELSELKSRSDWPETDFWFYDVQADGFSLDDKRDPVDENDQPDVRRRWAKRNRKKDTDCTAKAFFVPKQEIADNGYDLSINRYKEIVHQEVKYDPPKTILKRLKTMEAEIAKDLDELEKMLG